MDLAGLVSYVRTQGDAVVSTLGPDGEPQAAYLAIAATDRGELVFDAKDASRTIANIRRDPRVAIVIGGADGTTLQVQGLADIPAGADRDRCAEEYVRAFPQFVASMSDSAVTLIRVTAGWARYGDYRSGGSGSRDVDLQAEPR